MAPRALKLLHQIFFPFYPWSLKIFLECIAYSSSEAKSSVSDQNRSKKSFLHFLKNFKSIFVWKQKFNTRYLNIHSKNTKRDVSIFLSPMFRNSEFYTTEQMWYLQRNVSTALFAGHTTRFEIIGWDMWNILRGGSSQMDNPRASF